MRTGLVWSGGTGHGKADYEDMGKARQTWTGQQRQRMERSGVAVKSRLGEEWPALAWQKR